MYTQTKFCVCFTKSNTEEVILNFIFGDPKFPLTPKFRPSPNIKKLFLWSSEWDDELLSIPKIITFLPVSLSKL